VESAARTAESSLVVLSGKIAVNRRIIIAKRERIRNTATSAERQMDSNPDDSIEFF
jgi:hypothetical protein